MGTELYPGKNSISLSLWPVSRKGEIDLRKEFYEFLYGSTTEIAKGFPAILRRPYYKDGKLVKCSCVDKYTGEPDLDTICPYCWGEGYIWYEEWVTTYKVVVPGSTKSNLPNREEIHKPGLSNIPLVFFYFEYHIEPTANDKIIEVKLGTDGIQDYPYKRQTKYDIVVAQPFRSDTGRVEYWRCATVGETVKPTWG